LVTINNRGLAALSEAGMYPTNLTVIDKSQVEDYVIDQLGEIPTVLGEFFPSPNIAVTHFRIK